MENLECPKEGFLSLTKCFESKQQGGHTPLKTCKTSKKAVYKFNPENRSGHSLKQDGRVA